VWICRSTSILSICRAMQGAIPSAELGVGVHERVELPLVLGAAVAVADCGGWLASDNE